MGWLDKVLKANFVKQQWQIDEYLLVARARDVYRETVLRVDSEAAASSLLACMSSITGGKEIKNEPACREACPHNMIAVNAILFLEGLGDGAMTAKVVEAGWKRWGSTNITLGDAVGVLRRAGISERELPVFLARYEKK